MTKAKPTIGEELVAIQGAVKFGLAEIRTELKGLTKQVERVNGSVAEVVAWKLNHINEHGTAQKVADAQRSVWRSQWKVLAAGIGAGSGAVVLIGGVLALLGRF